MGKISQVSAKYIIHAEISIEGVVDKPDVIGAIFGQTEGLLGSELELRELQRSGRIGRIEVNSDTKGGKTKGIILLPSSLDKAETAIIAAALEVIQRIGPCNSKIEIKEIEDVRITKRKYVIDRAKALLKDLIETQLPDTQEITDEVGYSVRMMEIQDYGPEKLAAGPNIDDSDEIILVEGRADVLNLLKHGFKNAICLNGTNIPKTVINLCSKKTVTVFVDGDRGGNLILRGLLSVAEVDFVCRAPDGKELEELTKKEIHKGLRGKISAEQIKLELFDGDAPVIEHHKHEHSKAEKSKNQTKNDKHDKKSSSKKNSSNKKTSSKNSNSNKKSKKSKSDEISDEESEALLKSNMKRIRYLLEEIIGTNGVYLLDKSSTILGKVPIKELGHTLDAMSNGVHMLVIDGIVDDDIVKQCEKHNVKKIICMDYKAKDSDKVEIVKIEDIE